MRTDGRHAEVVFGKSFEKDAARRDFTINALFEDRAGQIYDYFGGEEDLRQRLLRFVGAPRERIQEDYLRILRFFRFWARFGLHPDEEALRAIAWEASGLAHISKERITMEFLGILAVPQPSQIIQAMAASGVLSVICAVTLDEPLNERMDDCARFEPDSRAIVRLALLLGEAIRREGDTPLTRHFRLSGHQINRIMSLATFGQHLEDNLKKDEALAMTLLDGVERFWKDGLSRDFLPAAEILFPDKNHLVRWLMQLETELGWLRIAPLPVDARTLMDTFHLAAGPQLGRLLSELKTHFRNRRWQSREEGLALAAELLKHPLSV